jgi:hypothetical protein
VNAAQVGALDTLGLDVRVADVVSDPTLLPAHGTLRWHNFLRKARTFSIHQWIAQVSESPAAFAQGAGLSLRF